MCSSMCVYSPVGFSDTSSEDSVFFQRREFFEILHQRSTTDHCREALIENALRLSSRASSR
ncbi:hypothetical protein J6590_099939 [Homalodisca vitripennis]|nr:hypothetical protein J6590_099939 [Homalodisca vitripennis]